jgi:hypothetical protein
MAGMMEGDEGGPVQGAGLHPHQPPRNPPNLWILVAITLLSLALTALVLLATTL